MSDEQTWGRRLPRVPGPAPALVTELARHPTTDLGDVMGYAINVEPSIAPIAPVTGVVAGPALTVSVPTGSRVVRREAIDMVEEGDVLVIAGYGAVHWALLGGVLAGRLADRGVAAVVIDGCARDLDEIRGTGIPTYCRGSSPVPPAAGGYGEINVPVACGGVAICPGDVVVADAHGVLVVARDDAAAVVSRLTASN